MNIYCKLRRWELWKLVSSKGWLKIKRIVTTCLTIWHFFLNSVIIVNSELFLSICLLIDWFTHAAESKKVILFFISQFNIFLNSEKKISPSQISDLSYFLAIVFILPVVSLYLTIWIFHRECISHNSDFPSQNSNLISSNYFYLFISLRVMNCKIHSCNYLIIIIIINPKA